MWVCPPAYFARLRTGMLALVKMNQDIQAAFVLDDVSDAANGDHERDVHQAAARRKHQIGSSSVPLNSTTAHLC